MRTARWETARALITLAPGGVGCNGPQAKRARFEPVIALCLRPQYFAPRFEVDEPTALLAQRSRLIDFRLALHRRRPVPVEGAGEVHCCRNGQETDDGAHQQRVVLKSQKRVNQCVQQTKDS